MAGKPRILTDHKDMLWSLIPLIVICLIIAVVSGNCSVGLNGGASDDKTPAYDVVNGMKADATVVAFPLRLPATPSGWKPNSGGVKDLDSSKVSNSGYITAHGVYMQLSQTNASEEALVADLNDNRPAGIGTTTVSGTTWVQYRTGDSKTIWTADLDNVHIGLYSKGQSEDFTTLAAAVAAGQVLAPADRPRPTG